MKKSKVDDILNRIKQIRKTSSQVKPNRVLPGGGVAYSTSVKTLKEQPSKTALKAPVPPSCTTYSKKGKGASAMTVPELKEFIRKNAPQAVYEKYTRLQRPSRDALCKILTEFKSGYNLLYPNGNKSETVEKIATPEANNLEGMFNLVNRLESAQAKKNAKKIVNRRNTNGFFIPVSPASPASLTGSPLGSPNYNNIYNNNLVVNEQARLAAENAYRRKLANKRVERDPLIGALSAANMKRFMVTSVKKNSKQPRAKQVFGPTPRRMSFNGGNMRKMTNTTRGLTISKSPRVNSVTMKKILNSAKNRKEALQKTLRTLENIAPSRRTLMQRKRISVLRKILDDPKLENKLVDKQKYRATIAQRLGLASPPRPRSPPKRAFNMIGKPTLSQQELLKAKMKKNENKPTQMSKKQEKELKEKIIRSMNLARARKNIANFRLEGKLCMSYKKSQLVKAAKLLAGNKVSRPQDLTKEELCQIIKQNIRSK